MSEPLVIIGNGMAAARFVEELDVRARGRYAVAVIGAEPHLAYNRVLLSSLLAGEIERGEIELRDKEWWRARGVTLIYGCGASHIDTTARCVVLSDGRRLPFAKLVFATGSSPLRLSIPGADLKGVLTFRDIADVSEIAQIASSKTRAVVVGGGLLGLEAAYGLSKQGARVSLLHLMPHLMERQLDKRAAAILKESVEARDIEVLCGADTAAIEGDEEVERVCLKDGRVIDADLVVMALGVRPNAGLAQQAGLSVSRGIVVSDNLSTSDPDIFAIGECAEHRGICYGLVEPAYEQASVLAQFIAGKPARYEGSTLATNLKVSGVNVFSAGDLSADGDCDEIVLADPSAGLYRRFILRNERLSGAILVGDTADALWYLDLIRSQTCVASFRDLLAFGRALSVKEAA